MSIKIITTEDGSHSLYNEEMNETYHSTKGALGESKYVFIEKGLEYFIQENNPKSINILEIGFGTGLNALLSYQFAKNNNTQINYTTLEPFPLSEEIISGLNYQFEPSIFKQIHYDIWADEMIIDDIFYFTKHLQKLENFQTVEKFDVIYFDAFAPSKQPEVWSLMNIQKCFNLLNQNGILTTYCSQGQFKRNLKEAGFQIEILQGAMGKKEMVRAFSTDQGEI